MVRSEDSAGLGRSIRSHRTRLGLSQQELAARAGVSVRTLRNLEQGSVVQPRPSSVRLLAAALGVDDLRPGSPPVPGPATVVRPAALPSDVHAFTGRVDELAALTALAFPAQAGPMRLAVVTGTAGVGKTALVVHWAHSVAPAFPDGQLYADLRGYSPEQPADPQDVLGWFLRRLGVEAGALPADPAERTALFRSLLAGRGMLVVLDNARSAEQVRPLLPGSQTCSTVVVSRDSLAALVARDGARRLDLELLPMADALGLLRNLLGDAAVDGDHAASVELAERCARLPLALRIVAEHIGFTGRSPAEVADELADRFAVLDSDGDPRTAVRTVFSWSVATVPPPVGRAFRLLGLHPGPDLDVAALAALLGVAAADARLIADQLVRAHLAHRVPPDRLGMHDLLRAYAADQVRTAETGSDRSAAVERLSDHLRWTALLAVDQIAGRLGDAPRGRRPATVTAALDARAAEEWLDRERRTLTWLTGRAADGGRPADATELATRLWPYLYLGGHQADALAVQRSGVQAARRIGDRDTEGQCLRRLGILHKRIGDYSGAVDCAEAALEVFRAIGARGREAEALNDLGVHYKRWGRYDDAVRSYEQALDVLGETGSRDHRAKVLDNLGLVYELRAEYQRAREQHQHALAMFIELEDANGAARARANLGQALLRTGALSAARECLEEALAELEQLGDRDGRGCVLDLLGVVALRSGRPTDALEFGTEAVRLRREVADRDGEAEALDHLGEAYLVLGQPAAALRHHEDALEMAVRIGIPLRRASALNGIAQALAATDAAAAVETHTQALAAAEDAGDQYERARALRGRATALATIGDLAAAARDRVAAEAATAELGAR